MPARTTHTRQKDPWLRALGQNVRQQRKAVNLTQEKLAELADLSPRTVQKIEAGRLNILVTTLRRIRAGMGCTYQDLLG